MALGNCSLIRPAQTTPQLAQILEHIIEKQDIGGLSFVYSDPMDTDFILSNPKVLGVSFTGSTAAGRKIAEIAGRNLKKSVLELGGTLLPDCSAIDVKNLEKWLLDPILPTILGVA